MASHVPQTIRAAAEEKKPRFGWPQNNPPASFAGCEGRCGMAAIRLKTGVKFEGQKLYAFTGETLPAYAAPRFVRIQVSGPGFTRVVGRGGGWLLGWVGDTRFFVSSSPNESVG